jgi:uncharacterized protein (UPF0276 family)
VSAAPRIGLSLMLEDDFREAVLPLFADEVVDALEWSFELGWSSRGVPEWADALLDCYAAEGRLYAHGVHLSALSGAWEDRQERWMDRAAKDLARRRYRHVSEHFGFMTAGAFARGAPLPVPYTKGAVALGRERLARLATIAGGVPVGLENLALAFGAEDVWHQGRFLRDLLEPLGGFLVLDLHNLYCQIENFGVDAGALLETYPLPLVRELHVSGGSWSHERFRRDTHDGSVPGEVLSLLPRVLERCPGVEVVVVERLGGTLGSADEAAQLRADFMEVRRICGDQP